MTKLPQELDTPENLLIGIKEMRDRQKPLSVRRIAKMLNDQGIYNRNRKWDRCSVQIRTKMVA